MTVLVKSINTFDLIQIDNVTSITYASSTYTITNADGSSTYSDDDYTIHII